MKKIFLTMFLFTAIIACSDDTGGISEVANSTLKAPEYGKDITLSGVSNNGDGNRAIIVITIGRKSQQCHRLGVCHVCIGCTPISQQNMIPTPINNNSTLGNYIEFYLDAPLDPEFDSNIYVDEDIYNEDTGELVLEQGIYPLNSSLGEFGGFIVQLAN